MNFITFRIFGTFKTIYYPGLRNYIVVLFEVIPRIGYIFQTRSALLKDTLIRLLLVLCSSCSHLVSFLFLYKQSTAYNLVIDLFPNLR